MRRIIPTRLLALTLAIALFLGNDYSMFPLAGVMSEQTNTIDNGESEEEVIVVGDATTQDGETTDSVTTTTDGTGNNTNGTSGVGDSGTNEIPGVDDSSTNENPSVSDSGTGETPSVDDDGHTHQWVEDSETGGLKCSICGISEDEEPEVEEPDEEECEHEVVGDRDPVTGAGVCIKCGQEVSCNHNWVEDSETGGSKCSICGIPNPDTSSDGEEEECDHDWVTDPDTSETKCSICGEVCSHDELSDFDPETGARTCNKCGTEIPCEHEWGDVDSETGKQTCIKCGIEKPEEECEHEWIRDPETLEVVCNICGVLNEDYEEDECPESNWGFHIYEENEDGTGYVCVLCGAEKEELDPLDITVEMFTASMYGIATLDLVDLSHDDIVSYSDDGIPDTVDALLASDKRIYVVTSLGQLLKLQELSKETDFDGFTIQFGSRETGLLSDKTSDAFWDLSARDKAWGVDTRSDSPNYGKPVYFEGLGSVDNPFRGKLETGAGGINFSLYKPLFKYLDVDATIGTTGWDVNFNGVIEENSDTPLGILAAHLVKTADDDADCVSLHRVTLSGKVNNISTDYTKGAAGLMFGRVEAFDNTSIELDYIAASIKMGSSSAATVTGYHAGGFAGETVGDVTVYIRDPEIIHNLTVESTPYWYSELIGSTSMGTNAAGEALPLNMRVSAAGMFVGAMNQGTLTIVGSSVPYTAKVTGGGCNGGFVGMALGGTKVTTAGVETEDSVTSVTSAGTVSGGIAGGILGYFEHPEDMSDQMLTLENIAVTASVSANRYSAGGVLGRYYRDIDGDADSITDDTIDKVTVSGRVAANASTNIGNAGGVVGFVNGSNLVIGSPRAQDAAATEPYAIIISGQKFAGNAAGGVVGMIRGQYVEIQNAHISGVSVYGDGNYLYANYGGGIVGTVGSSTANVNDYRNSIVKISDIKITGALGGTLANKYRGGLLGYVFPGCMVALDKKIESYNLGTTVYWGATGHIAGGQNEALIYLEEGAEYQRPAPVAFTSESIDQNYYDDIGNYGGVYRNRTWGESGALFSYENSIVNGAVSKSGSNWLIDSEADFIRLAVMLNTEGKFASNCFSGATKADLLAGHYKVTKSLDLTESGIYCLNRNDYSNALNVNQTFTGHFIGSGSNKVTIKLGDLKTRQSYLSLFPRVGGGVEISGFTLKRTIYGTTRYGAGIAAASYDGNFTARDLYIDLTPAEGTDADAYGLKGYDSSQNRWLVRSLGVSDALHVTNLFHYYAGLVAYVEADDGITFTVDNVRINGRLSADHSYGNANYYSTILIGGMTAYYKNKNASTTTTISVNKFELMEKFKIDSAHAYRASGMITEINSGDGTVYTSDKTILSMTDIKIHNGANITLDCNNSSYQSGGWLGRYWYNIIPDKTKHYSIKDITIGDGGSYEAGPSYTSGYYFGGLVDTVTGRIQLKDINIQNAYFNNKYSRSEIGLLFRLGYYALIEIDGYTIDGRGIGDTEPNNDGNVKIDNCGNIAYYDEIVARNMNTSTYGSVNYSYYYTGGIVNIIYTGFSDTTNNTADHKVYQNRLLTTHNNRGTRYYYNLFGSTGFADEDSYLQGNLLTKEGTTVSNARQMMIWHLTQYMNDSIRRFLAPYYEGGTVDDISKRSADTTFSGAIDLNTVSYYPTPVGVYGSPVFKFADNATITFYGADIIAKATDKMTPSDYDREHYMMHSGLFLSQTGFVTVMGADQNSFLTLKGSVTYLPPDGTGYGRGNSGALFSRSIAGEKRIYRVKFDGLYVAGYENGRSNHPTGLMIGMVLDSSVLDISWIETTGYAVNRPTKYAASALIGRVGDLDARYITIEFKNMKVDSRNRDNGGIFYYASFIDEHYYLADTSTSSSYDNGTAWYLRRVRYLFTEAAFRGTNGSTDCTPFDGQTGKVGGQGDDVYGANQYAGIGSYVTIGRELGEGVEYWDVGYGPKDNETFTGIPFYNGTLTWDQTTIEGYFLPYVHTEGHTSSKDIEVNPKNKSITEGCGTYEDPYIIDDPKQLLALARYLQNMYDYKYLDGWQIREFESGRGGDGFCDGEADHSGESLKTYVVTPSNSVYLEPGFPTQEQLSQAYYKITCNIDLSDMGNATDRVIAEDFVGLGTQRIPFRGVIIGEYSDDGREKSDVKDSSTENRPKITMPRKSFWTDDSASADINYGLIQYSIGTVVKDLRIQGATDNPGKEKTGTIKVRDNAGGVMAVILGGDNIIDNVSVALNVAITDNNTAIKPNITKDCTAGAYVGVVERGSLILRNLHEDCAANFHAGRWDYNLHCLVDQDLVADFDTVEDYHYVSGLIGKVADGCVIYDDTAGAKYNGGPVLKYDSFKIDGIYRNDAVEVVKDTNSDHPNHRPTTAQLPICKHYDIIVQSYLDKDAYNSNGTGKIQVKTESRTDAENGARTHYVATVQNAAQLQIVSMVINSDAFSIHAGYGGYKKDAACRKANYNKVGANDLTSSYPDWTNATTEDDEKNYYPYLYRYFSFGGNTTIDGIKNYTMGYYHYSDKVEKDEGGNEYVKEEIWGDISKLNMAYSGIEEIMDYELDKSGNYDLSVYGRGFRGIGATYDVGSSFYSDFRANFNGKGATINLGIDMRYEQDVYTAALFNDLIDRDVAGKNYYTIENFTVTGSVENLTYKKKVVAVKDDSGKTENKYIEVLETTGDGTGYSRRTAAVVGCMYRPWKMSNITVKDMTITGEGNTAGLVAWIVPISHSQIVWVDKGEQKADPWWKYTYEFEKCHVVSSGTTDGATGKQAQTKIAAYAGSVGGIIGIVSRQDNYQFKTTVNLSGCTVEGTSSAPVEITVENRTKDSFEVVTATNFVNETNTSVQGGVGRSGGFIGYLGKKYNDATMNNNGTFKGTNDPMITVNIDNAGTDKTKISYANITGAYSTGGVIGAFNAKYGDFASTVTISAMTVENCEIEGTRGNYSYDANLYYHGVGGVIGEMCGYALKIKGNASDKIKVHNTNISAPSDNAGTALGSDKHTFGLYTGGVVGSLRTAADTYTTPGRESELKYIEVSGDKDTNAPSSLELGGQKYVIRSGWADAGGVIGRAIHQGAYNVSPTLSMSHVTVSGMYITVDKRTKDDALQNAFATTVAAVSGASGEAGGVIGANEMNLTISGGGTQGNGATVENCMITADRCDAGGIIGLAARPVVAQSGVTYKTRSTDIQDIKVTNNIIGFNSILWWNSIACGAGGVYGRIQDSSYWNNGYPNDTFLVTSHRLENAEISECWIYGYSAGGVLGYSGNYERLYSNGNGDPDSTLKLSVDGNKIYGTYVGGAMGYCGSSQVNYIGTQVMYNQLQAYGTSANARGCVGGFVGYATNGSSSGYHLDNLVIKSNNIFAGNTSVEGEISAGGLFGDNRWANCYIYEPVLTDNKIGYYATDVGKALKMNAGKIGFAELQALFNNTDGEMKVDNSNKPNANTPKLLAGKSLKAEGMPTVAKLQGMADPIGYYGGRIGNFVGYNGAIGHTFILAPKIVYSKDDAARPVIDVGMLNPTDGKTEPNSAYLLGSPYAYRSNIHVIYYEPKATATTYEQNLWNNELTIDGCANGDEWKYLFSGIDYTGLMDKYRKVKNGDSTITLGDYLSAYRLNVVADDLGEHLGEKTVEYLYENLYYTSSEGVPDYKSTLRLGDGINGDRIPMIRLDTEHGTTDELMKGVIAALTGVGGVYNCEEDNIYSNSAGMGTITKITAEKMVMDHNCIIKKDTSSQASLRVDGTIKKSINYDDFDDDGIKYNDDGSQELTDHRTFTLVTVTYEWNYTPGGGTKNRTNSVEIKIPVFVDERLTIDIHAKIVEGLQYNAEEVQENGLSSDGVPVANDSSYTLFMEYIYGKARTKYEDFALDKNIGFSYITGDGNQKQYASFAKGTKLTLIDVDDNNRVYYYIVDGTELEKFGSSGIPFTAFKDADGNSYTNKPIHTSTKDNDGNGFKVVEGDDDLYTTREYYQADDEPSASYHDVEYKNVAVERFLITVDISGVAEEDLIQSQFYDFEYRPTIDPNFMKKTTLTENSDLQLRILNGIKIKFYQKNKQTEDTQKPVEDGYEVTWIEGTIRSDEEDGFVDIWGTIRILADDFYWREVRQSGSVIDSSNNGKYLELKIYLTEEENGGEIVLPAGTNVSIEGERTMPSGVTGVMQDGYIDWTQLDPYYGASNIYFHKDGSLVFRMDDISEIIEQARVSTNKEVLEIRWFDYLRLDFRTADMEDFDLENYYVHIDLLRTENPNYPAGGDVMDYYYRQLDAIHKEDLACAIEPENLIDLGINTYDDQTKMPHTILFDYKMDFNGVLSPTTKPEDVAKNHYTVAYRIWEKQFKADGKSYEYVPYNGDKLELALAGDPGDQKDAQDQKKLTRVEPKGKNGLLYWYTDYLFEPEEIEKGTDGSPGVILRKLSLTVDDAEHELDLSNYKVQAILYVSDDDGKGNPVLTAQELDLDSNTTLSDFFVFTIAKLKTDLDY